MNYYFDGSTKATITFFDELGSYEVQLQKKTLHPITIEGFESAVSFQEWNVVKIEHTSIFKEILPETIDTKDGSAVRRAAHVFRHIELDREEADRRKAGYEVKALAEIRRIDQEGL